MLRARSARWTWTLLGASNERRTSRNVVLARAPDALVIGACDRDGDKPGAYPHLTGSWHGGQERYAVSVLQERAPCGVSACELGCACSRGMQVLQRVHGISIIFRTGRTICREDGALYSSIVRIFGLLTVTALKAPLYKHRSATAEV